MDSSFSVVLKEQIRPDAIIHLNGTKITVGDTIIYEHLFEKELMKKIIAYAQDDAAHAWEPVWAGMITTSIRKW